MKKMRKFSTYIVIGCMVLFAMLLGSCERDTWQAGYESTGSGEPVNVLLSFEVPQADDVAVTRTMSELEEHNITDLYVLVFDANTQKLISRQYYDDDALEHTKEDHMNGEWGSVLDAKTNSTHATVMATAVKTSCLIFGIANVRGDDSEVSRSTTNSNHSTLDDALLAMKTTKEGEATATTLDEFYNLQAELKNGLSLGRINSHLLMSGVFVLKDKYKPTISGYDAFTSKYQKGTAGLVNLSQDNIQELIDENTGAIDLTQAGVIRLRRVASHITFKISINADKNGNGLIDNDEKIFSDFKPESWQVLHVPNRSYLMDQGLESIKINGDVNFTDSEVERSMLHAEDKYVFDFYMYENHKSAIGISDKTGDDYEYYKTHFGNTINDVNATNRTLYTDDEEFKYFKRDMALKGNDGKYLTDTDGEKQFVYVEPNATYVVIKGRLRFNTDIFGLKDLIGDKNTTDAIKDGYADVTYLVHLGYARTRSVQDETLGNDTGTQAYKFEDFNSLRNTEYTYYLTIQGVNSIYTQVVTETPDDQDKREPAKLQAGASGYIGIASEGVYNTDAHFNSFIIFLDKPHLDKDGFYFEIRTPWNTIKSTDITDENYATHYKNNPDFTWIKVRRNYVQTFGTNTSDPVNYIGNGHRAAMPYYKATGDDYQTICPLIDLYQLKKEMELFADKGLQVKVGDTEYGVGETAKLKFSDLNLTDENKNNDGLFYTVFLDEYYYQSPPLRNGSPVWSTANDHEPYWHEFVNKPARFVSLSTDASGTFSTTHDGESSIIKPQLMIVQPSIQSHYATDGGVTVGLGMEHYNETPHPRWTDNGSAGTPSGSYDRKYGWVNAKNHMAKSTVTWNEYVADYVGKYNNLTMTPKANATTPIITNGAGDGDAQYLANAIRLCMNRNRDENGNGYIDESELKWYLPASEQIDIINMCHFSYFDPLLNYNNYTYGLKNGKMRYRMRKSTLDGEGDYPAKFEGQNCYNYHFVTSDNMKLIGEEMMNLNTYGTTGNWATRPGQMRCVRNLGEEASKVGTTKVKKLYFAYNLDNDDKPTGTVTSVTNEEETQTYPGSAPQEIFEFLGRQSGSGNPWTNKIFVMEKYLDSRSIRSAKYMNEELPDHYLFSETNRPYKAFKVAQNYVAMKKSDPAWTVVYSNTRYFDLSHINDHDNSPCSKYSEDADGKDKGSWRAPNAAELSLMIHYLRISNTSGKADEKSPALFFGNTSNYAFCSTSWNWAGDFNIRMVAVKQDNTYTRKLWMSDPYRVYSDKGTMKADKSNFYYDVANAALYDGADIIVRCVKDVEPPINN